MAVTTTTYLLPGDQSHFHNGLAIYFTWSLYHKLHINTTISFFNQLNPSCFNEYIIDYLILSPPCCLSKLIPDMVYVTLRTYLSINVSVTYMTTMAVHFVT